MSHPDPAKTLAQLRRAIPTFDFQPMFIKVLGWDMLRDRPAVEVDGATYQLQPVAQKRGVAVFWLAADALPAGATRNKIETQVARTHREHILIFSDTARTQQVWLWALREPGRPLARRSFHYHAGQSGERLAQQLQPLAFSLDEEDDLTLVDVTGRVRAAFNVERATKRFYDQFRRVRDAFERFVRGIPDVDMGKWYVSVMLNRLMFVYFIQKKGFLDGDPDYLRHRLERVRATYGDDQFDRFYRYFLLRLFHEGLGRPERVPELDALLGRVPYLNGGIFQIHEVEQRYPDIEIPDEAFARVFDFFDQYQWHLDDRPLRDDREINPDVLGYIFEKYINQKQMGAYYTKEDITDYISKNTIIPFLFDRAREGCSVAFGDRGAPTGEASVWAAAAADPDRYIHEAARHGAERPLPPEIAAGIDDPARRAQWNTPTDDEWGLPTEIWRETVARRQRYEATRARLAAGEVTDINDFITLNLDIRQFAQDVVEQAEGADLLMAFWRALSGVSVLDPTCGSGAFLFAALNVLEPLYEAAIGRMRDFTGSDGWRRQHPRYAGVFDGVLADIDRHPNEAYYIQKTIIVNNLYGVDIMAEAVEIARLRLFLKLASRLESVDQVEPLPDIDFNIRAGNTLVGYVKREEVRAALEARQVGAGVQQRRIIFGEEEDALQAIEEQAADIDRLYGEFRAMQTAAGLSAAGLSGDTAAAKAEINRRLAALNDELDRLLARQYGEKLDKGKAFDQWRHSHQPFHWFTNFYGILRGGGFDVVGNPPYVRYSKVKSDYTVQGYITEPCNDLYAFTFERCLTILADQRLYGLIVPISLAASEKMTTLRIDVCSKSNILWLSHFAIRPQPLFAGVMQRNTIALGKTGKSERVEIHSTTYMRWTAEERGQLFDTLQYTDLPSETLDGDVFPKLGLPIETSILSKLHSSPTLVKDIETDNGAPLYFHDSGETYWMKALLKKPKAFRDGVEVEPSQWLSISVLPEQQRTTFLLLNSNLFYWYWTLMTDCRHLTKGFVRSLPVPELQDIDALVSDLEAGYEEHTVMFAKRGHNIFSRDCGVKDMSRLNPQACVTAVRHVTGKPGSGQTHTGPTN